MCLLVLARLQVKLLGFCVNTRDRLLVYEYMSNGSLFDHSATVSAREMAGGGGGDSEPFMTQSTVLCLLSSSVVLDCSHCFSFLSCTVLSLLPIVF